MQIFKRTRVEDGRPRKVAFAYDGVLYGGVELYLPLLIRNIDPARYQVSIVISGYSRRFSPQRFLNEVEALGIPILAPPDPGERRTLNYLKDVVNLRKLFKDNQFDILHAHTCLPNGARRTTLGAFLAGVPTIMRTEHTPPSASFKPHHRYANKPFDWMNTYVISGSQEVHNEQIHLMHRDPKKLVQMYYGIELDRFNAHHNVAEAKRKLGFDPNIPVVGAIGRLADQKGHSYLVEAAAQVIKQFGPVNFMIVGDGDLKENLLQQAAQLGIEKYLHLMGFQSNTVPYMEAMDICTLPSIYEGLSLTMLDYLAMGKPTIVTDIPCSMEVVKHEQTGLVAKTQDGASIAQQICRLLQDPQLAARVAKNGHDLVQREFGIKYNAEQLMKLYDKALGITTILPDRSHSASQLVS